MGNNKSTNNNEKISHYYHLKEINHCKENNLYYKETNNQHYYRYYQHTDQEGSQPGGQQGLHDVGLGKNKHSVYGHGSLGQISSDQLCSDHHHLKENLHTLQKHPREFRHNHQCQEDLGLHSDLLHCE